MRTLKYHLIRLQEPPGRAAVQEGAKNTNGNKSFEFVPILPDKRTCPGARLRLLRLAFLL